MELAQLVFSFALLHIFSISSLPYALEHYWMFCTIICEKNVIHLLILILKGITFKSLHKSQKRLNFGHLSIVETMIENEDF